MLGLRDHPAARVEERGRAVAPLLDVRRERGADEDGAHLVRDRAERGADHLELDPHFTVSARSRDSFVSRSVLLVPSLTPTHPGGSQQVAPSSSTTPGPVASSGSAARKLERAGPGARRRCARRRARSPARGRRSRSAPRARGGTPPRARAAAAPSARTTGRGSAGRPRPPRGSSPASASGQTYERTESRRSSRDDEAERREDARGLRARAPSRIPSSSASAHACSGAGAAEGDERELARIVAALDRDEPQRAQHLGVHDLDRLGRVDSRRTRARQRSRSSSSPPASRAREPAEQQVRVGHRRPRAARVRSRRAPDRRRRSRARRAARRRGRARRSSRRRRRPSAGRPSAAAAASRRPRAPTLRPASPPRSGRRRSRCRPCRT